MATSDIITGQFVRISQTPASAGDRIIARIIDMGVIVLYLISLLVFFEYARFRIPVDMRLTVFLFMVSPAIFYSFLCETFNHGQTVGKRIMKMRVIKADGSSPSTGDYLLRWVLLSIDLYFNCMGLLAILCTKRRQRFGDLAAGTMVIKLAEYKKLHISLDEFDYARSNYSPVYPEAAQLSLGQVDVIRKILYGSKHYNSQQAALLAEKIQKILAIQPKDGDPTKFLTTLLHDYQHYALELV